MTVVFVCLYLLSNLSVSVYSIYLDSNYTDRNIKKIAFGSCNNLRWQLDHFQTIADIDPDVWLWTGDIVYGKTKHGTDLSNVRKNYERVVCIITRQLINIT